VADVVLGMTILLLVAETVGFDTGDGPSTTSSWIKIVLGVLLLLLGVRQWRSRPKKGAPVALPKWMAAIDHVTPVKAAGLGLLLSSVNPKNLLGKGIGGLG
jgi:threonine/homoserine/homoserine lactone efflux protein